jgi:hypothetical protein
MSKIVHARLDAESQKILQRLARRTGWADSSIIRRGIRLLAELTLLSPKNRIVGIGMFNSGLSDLASNKKHLRDFGRD